MRFAIDVRSLPPLELRLLGEWPAPDDPRVIVYATTFDLRQLRGRFAEDVVVADRVCKRVYGKGKTFGKGKGDAWVLLIRFGPKGHGQAALELSIDGERVWRRVIDHPAEELRMAFQQLMMTRYAPRLVRIVSEVCRGRRSARMTRRSKARRREILLRSAMVEKGLDGSSGQG